VLHLDVSKVDRMLHLSPRFLLSCLGVSSSFPTPTGHPPPPPLLLEAKRRGKRLQARASGHLVRLDVWTLASPYYICIVFSKKILGNREIPLNSSEPSLYYAAKSWPSCSPGKHVPNTRGVHNPRMDFPHV
jgi:hypothetical protein